MKRLYILVLASLCVLASCTKTQVQALPDGEKVTVNFVAEMPTDEAVVKATIDGDGKGIYADQCRLQIWWGDELFYENTVAVSDYKAKFENIILVKDQTYDFLFWADNAAGTYYDADTLTKVSLAGTYVGGKDQRDAFFGALTAKTVTEGFSETVYLYRPFAQLNVITVDIPDLYAQSPLAAQKIVPDSIGLKVTVPTVFNVKTGVASDSKEITYEAPVYTNPFKTTASSKNTLSMDYLFAPATDGNVVQVQFWAKNSTSGIDPINWTFSNIPLQRNFRTNIVGSIITVKGEVKVEIKPDWYGEYQIDE